MGGGLLGRLGGGLVKVMPQYCDLVSLQMGQVLQILQVGLPLEQTHVQTIDEADGAVQARPEILLVDFRQFLKALIDFLAQKSALSCQNPKGQLVLSSPPHLPECQQCQCGPDKGDDDGDHPVRRKR
jgi:hypothetical protein